MSVAKTDKKPLLEVKNLKTHFFTEDGVVHAVDGVDFAVGRGIVGRGHGVDSLAQNPSVTHDQGGKWSARAADNVVRGQRDGAAQELRIGICRHLVIDPTD